jgi:hypothetical protein
MPPYIAARLKAGVSRLAARPDPLVATTAWSPRRVIKVMVVHTLRPEAWCIDWYRRRVMAALAMAVRISTSGEPVCTGPQTNR